MKRYRWLLAGALAGVALLAGLLVAGRTREQTSANLIFVRPTETRAVLPLDQAFILTTATIGGVTKPAIFTQPESRFTWRQMIPENAWLRVSVALREDAWTKPGDGVLFRVGMTSAGHPYEDIGRAVVNPYANPGDRRWIDLTLDLSAYAGETSNIILSTNASVPGVPPNHDNDLALWGAPRIVIR
jgi:hypothetical protein